MKFSLRTLFIIVSSICLLLWIGGVILDPTIARFSLPGEREIVLYEKYEFEHFRPFYCKIYVGQREVESVYIGNLVDGQTFSCETYGNGRMAIVREHNADCTDPRRTNDVVLIHDFKDGSTCTNVSDHLFNMLYDRAMRMSRP